MMNRTVSTGLLAAALAGAWVGAWVGAWAQGAGTGALSGKRPMTFADLQRMKRVSDPQISPSGRWVMFSVTDVDLEKNSKVNHLWVAPLGDSAREADSSPSDKLRVRNDKQKNRVERQVSLWKEGESGGRFSPDGRQVLFISEDGGTSSQIYL
jgi:dipeptidyl aminopeptidase/acylaminoacyl peptidase